MKEKIYSISDIEMGRGDITDDFSDDVRVAEFLEDIKAQNKDEKVTLVLNGDIFDFLKMCYENEYPRYITQEISFWKLEQTFQNHQKVFQALREFLADPRHRIHFVIGNHDADLIWPALQARLKEKLGNEDRVTFDYWFKHKDLHAEHGHLQDPFFRHNTKKPIISFRGKKILNLPWGSYACFSHLVQLKKKYPKEECMFPNPEAMKRNKAYARESRRTTVKLALQSFLVDPITHLGDPTYKVPYLAFAQHFLHYGLDVLDDEKFIRPRAEEVMRNNPDKKVLLLGHAHLFEIIEEKGQKVLVTDTWRDEYDLTRNGIKKPKSYSRVEWHDDKLMQADLKEWP